MGEVADLISKYGFPIVAAVGMGYMIYFIYKWVTTEIKPVIGQANNTLIALIDRIRMLDNDLIRLNQKVETVLQLRGKVLEHERILADKQINQLVEDVPIGSKRKATSKEIKDASGDD
jgi:hypothetical protein